MPWEAALALQLVQILTSIFEKLFPNGLHHVFALARAEGRLSAADPADVRLLLAQAREALDECEAMLGGECVASDQDEA